MNSEKLTHAPDAPDRGWSQTTIEMYYDCCYDLLRRGRLYPATLHLLNIYCDSYDIYETVNDILKFDRENLVKTDRDTTRKSVFFSIRKTAVDEMKNYERKLGFSPYYADRVKEDTSTETVDPMDLI